MRMPNSLVTPRLLYFSCLALIRPFRYDIKYDVRCYPGVLHARTKESIMRSILRAVSPDNSKTKKPTTCTATVCRCSCVPVVHQSSGACADRMTGAANKAIA